MGGCGGDGKRGNEDWVCAYLFVYLFCWSLKITYRAADLKALYIA